MYSLFITLIKIYVTNRKNKSKLCRNLQFFFKTEKIDKLQFFFWQSDILYALILYIFRNSRKKTSHILSKLSLRYSETPVIFLIIFAKQRQCNLNRCLLQNVRYKKWSIHVSFSFQKMPVMWTHRCQWFRNIK